MHSSSSSRATHPESDSDQQPRPHQATWLNLAKRLAKPLSGSDHHKLSILSSSDSTDLSPQSNLKNQSPPDHLILDAFLKNNGGYLDDSDSSDSEDHSSSELNQNDHTLRVLAKKYQHEPDSEYSVPNPLIGLNFSKNLFKVNFNRSNHYHRQISKIIDQSSVDQFPTKTNRNGHHRFFIATSVEIDQLHDHQIQLHRPAEKPQPERSATTLTIPTIRNDKLQIQMHPKRNRRHVNHQRYKDEDWNLNSKYIQSSTFPTKNTILDPEPFPQHHNNSLNRSYDRNQHSRITSKNDSHLKKSKSPFRNLVLGQDDLLRSH